jgi:ATP-dependent DNA ligase
MISYFYPQVPTLISVTQPLFSQLDKDADTVAELKINGTHLILKRFSSGSYEFWNRTGEKLQYRPSTEVLRNLDALKWEGDCELDGELEHTKVHSRKHTIMLHDVIIWNGELLTNKTFAERRKILESLFGDMVNVMDVVEKRDYGKLKNLTVYPSIQWKRDYKKIYDEYIKFEEVEGLVVKKLSALLRVGTRDCPIVTSMFKVRRPHKNYRF